MEQSKEFGFAKLSASQLAFEKSNIVSVYQAGAFFGSLFAYISAYYLGRRKSLWVFATIFEIGMTSTGLARRISSTNFLSGAGIMLAAKNGNLGPIYGGRVLAGVGVGGELLKILLCGTD